MNLNTHPAWPCLPQISTVPPHRAPGHGATWMWLWERQTCSLAHLRTLDALSLDARLPSLPHAQMNLPPPWNCSPGVAWVRGLRFRKASVRQMPLKCPPWGLWVLGKQATPSPIYTRSGQCAWWVPGDVWDKRDGSISSGVVRSL